MKVGILTSSRADYGIYMPLLKRMKADPFFDFRLIAFGTHLSRKHGYDVDQIRKAGFTNIDEIKVVVKGDKPENISTAIGNYIKKFSTYWKDAKYDIVIASGDRYEMFAAVVAALPFNIKIVHIHAGETTRGAIDNAFRHAITHMSSLCFVSAEEYRVKAVQLTGDEKIVFNTGALSVENLCNLNFYSKTEIKKRYGVDMNNPTILVTFHPETVSYKNNVTYINELMKALKATKGFQFIITMPNTDTMGNMIREKFSEFIRSNPAAYGFESLGTLAYLSCMKWSSIVLGNSSSGFVEASFFPKVVINLGIRQQGRIVTNNIINCEIKKENILSAIKRATKIKTVKIKPIYGDGKVAEKMIKILKTKFK